MLISKDAFEFARSKHFRNRKRCFVANFLSVECAFIGMIENGMIKDCVFWDGSCLRLLVETDLDSGVFFPSATVKKLTTNDMILLYIISRLEDGTARLRAIQSCDMGCMMPVQSDEDMSRGVFLYWCKNDWKQQAKWCRAVSQYCDEKIINFIESDIEFISGPAYKELKFIKKNKISYSFANYIENFGFPETKETMEYDCGGLNSPALLENLEKYKEIIKSGPEGIRNWRDVLRERPWLARQALTDKPLLDAILLGKRLGVFIERRLDLTPKNRKILETYAKHAVMQEENTNHHPVLSKYMKNEKPYDEGIAIIQHGDSIRWMPEKLKDMDDEKTREKFAPRSAFLTYAFEMIWFSDFRGSWSKRKDTNVLMIRGVSLNRRMRDSYPPADWRYRAPLYARKAMMDMVSGGGFNLNQIEESREVLDSLVGLCRDVFRMRIWCITQTVGSEIARMALEKWQNEYERQKEDLDFIENESEYLFCTISRMLMSKDRRYFPRLLIDKNTAHEWFWVGASGLCSSSGNPTLFSAFSDRALPRSVKRLRGIVDGWHRLLTLRGLAAEAENNPDHKEIIPEWEPLIENGNLILEGFPDITGVCLTKKDLLVEEGVKMKHCVASYAFECSQGGSHILSIRGKDGTRLSTMNIRLSMNESYSNHRRENRQEQDLFRLKIVEHRGFQNGPVPEKAAEWAIALQECLDGKGNSLALSKGVMESQAGKGSGFWIEHNPWGSDAEERENEVYVLFDGSGFNRGVARQFAERLLTKDIPWVRFPGTPG